jgi:hypothetical protein
MGGTGGAGGAAGVGGDGGAGGAAGAGSGGQGGAAGVGGAGGSGMVGCGLGFCDLEIVVWDTPPVDTLVSPACSYSGAKASPIELTDDASASVSRNEDITGIAKVCGAGSPWEVEADFVAGGSRPAGYFLGSAADNSLYYAVRATLGPSAFEFEIGKVATDGMKDWTETLPSSVNDRVYAVVSNSLDDGVYVYGYHFGQFPGEPAEDSNAEFIARYGPDGTQIWLDQSPSYGPLLQPLLQGGISVDGGGNMYLLVASQNNIENDTLTKIGPSGQVLWSRNARDQSGRVFARSDGYVYVSLRTADFGLALIDPDGNELWAKNYQVEHEVEIDPIEGVIWRGFASISGGLTVNFPTGLAAVFDGDEVYVAGRYSNSYEFGSTPRAPHDNVFVAALEEETGNMVRLGQYRVSGDLELTAFDIDPNGVLQIAGKTTEVATEVGQPTIIRHELLLVDAATGAPVEP